MEYNKTKPFIGRLLLLAATIIVAGVMAVSLMPNTGYAATVDATSSATTIATPTLSSVVSVRYDSLKLSWTTVGNATKYEVYRATSSTGTYSKVATVGGTTFTNTGLTTGKAYYYKVRAVVVSGSDSYKGSFSNIKGAKAIPGTPSIAVAKASTTSIKVSWTGIAGTTKYAIYRATSPTGTFSHVYSASASARSWTNTGLVAGKAYYYKVRSYHLEGTTKIFGKYSKIAGATL